MLFNMMKKLVVPFLVGKITNEKPYLLIAGDKYYPSGYTDDWRGCFETYEEAEERLKEYDYDWYQIVDLREWT